MPTFPDARSPRAPRPRPMPSIRRLPAYLRLLARFRAEGDERVSCTRIARELALDATQVRKDLAITGITGRPRIGYEIGALMAAVRGFLDWETPTEALLVGVGNLGRALLGYEPFAHNGLDIVMAFDADASRVGGEVFGRPVYGMGELSSRAGARGVRVGLLTVPGRAAEEVARSMVEAGVVGIWNFTPAWLPTMPGVWVEQVDLLSSWAGLSARMRRADALDEPS